MWLVKLAPEVMPIPELTIQVSGNNAVMRWPSVSTGFVLERSPALDAANWVSVSEPPADEGTNRIVTVPLDSTPAYFRLRKP
jgi:hypothetical protein